MSTNDDVAALAAGGAPEGTCVVAEEQTRGRGRLGRQWLSPAGAGLSMSVLIRPGEVSPARWGLLAIVAGLAVRDAIGEVCAVSVGLKWPNDVVVPTARCGGGGGYLKLGGILCQVEGTDAIVVGIGVNVALTRDELPTPLSTSVYLEGGRPDRGALLVDLLRRLPVRLEQWRSEEPRLLADYRASCLTIGRVVDVALPDGTRTSGIATDVDDLGHLLIADGTRTSRISAGDVVHASL